MHTWRRRWRTCDPCSTYDPHGTGGGAYNWDGTAAAGLRCVAVDKADCDTEDAAINAALPYSETVTVSASDHADTRPRTLLLARPLAQSEAGVRTLRACRRRAPRSRTRMWHSSLMA